MTAKKKAPSPQDDLPFEDVVKRLLAAPAHQADEPEEGEVPLPICGEGPVRKK